jgi:hypothetical protein
LDTNLRLADNDFLQSCLSGELIHLQKLRDLFLHSKLKPSIAALALKILDSLINPVFVDQRLSGLDALWLLCHLLMLSAQIDALDPKFITASKLCIGDRRRQNNRATVISLYDETWLNQILASLPTIEVDDVIEIDVLAAAFMKTLVGKIGARGESTILVVGIGLAAKSLSDGLGSVEALWCEAHLPDSMNECGPKNSARLSFMYEVSGEVPITAEMPHLSSMMSLHGAISIAWHLVHGEKTLMHNRMKFLCTDEDKHEVIEAFLIKGEAKDVNVRMVERHELNKRLVSVPIGMGNKTSALRFYEYIYYDKTVRVEPLKEDLDQYVQKTDYSVDVARSDLLMAWKKWRSRIAMEDR